MQELQSISANFPVPAWKLSCEVEKWCDARAIKLRNASKLG
jgi:hypothetical protein